MVRPSKQRDGVGVALDPANLRSPRRGGGPGGSLGGRCRGDRGRQEGPGAASTSAREPGVRRGGV